MAEAFIITMKLNILEILNERFITGFGTFFNQIDRPIVDFAIFNLVILSFICILKQQHNYCKKLILRL